MEKKVKSGLKSTELWTSAGTILGMILAKKFGADISDTLISTVSLIIVSCYNISRGLAKQ